MAESARLPREEDILLAMILGDLDGQTEGRSVEWIELQLGLSSALPDLEAVGEAAFSALPRLLRPVFQWFAGKSAATERENVQRALAAGVEMELLGVANGSDDPHYTTNENGRRWAEELYESLAYDESSSTDPEWTAASICYALAENIPNGLSTEALLIKVFPSITEMEQLTVLQQKFQSARNGLFPGLLQDGLARAVENGWIERNGERWSITAAGETDGAHYFDNFR